MDEPGCNIFVPGQSTDVVHISHRLSHAQWDMTNKTWHVFVKSGHNVLADTAPLCHTRTCSRFVCEEGVGRIQQMWSHSWFVFVDSDVVVTQSKQRGYQWTRQTDAGVPACCFTNWVSAGNLYRLWRYNENSNGPPDFYQRAQYIVYQFAPFFLFLFLFSLFSLFHFHRYWFLCLFTAWRCSGIVFLHWQVN